MNPPASPNTPAMQSGATEMEDHAIMWLTERDDLFSPVREREFAQWLAADSRHAATVVRLEQTLGLLNELPEFRAELNAKFDRVAPVVPFSSAPAGQAPARRVRRWPQKLAWTGAAAALALGALTAWHTLQQPAEARYQTAAVGYQRARLDDGSTLELNAASAVRVKFTAAERSLKLDTGEACFAVTHDSARPFIVSAGEIAVRAVGTVFNVRYVAEGGVEVTVTEGKVRVGQFGPASAAAESATLVSAGQRFLLPKHAPPHPVEQVDPTSLWAALAWQSTLVDFADAPLADVVARFNSRSRIQIILDDDKIGDRRIGGTFRLDEAETFVRLLGRDGEIVCEHRNESEIHLRLAR